MRKIKFILLLVLFFGLLTGCSNKETSNNKKEEKYDELLEKLDTSNIKIEDNSVYYNDGVITIEYYPDDENEEYLYFSSWGSDYLLVYNITKKSMITFNTETEEYCILEDNENSISEQIKCNDENENELLTKNQTESHYIAYVFKEFLKEKQTTKENIINAIKIYYSKNK